MTRRRRRQSSANVSLDSMLDIVTNSLGLLILVATLTASSSEGIQVTLGSPIMQFADDDLQVIEFELSHGEMRPVDVEFIMPDLQQFFDVDASVAQFQSTGAAFNQRDVQDDYYRFRFDLQERAIVLVPKEELAGDTIDDLQDPTSEIRLRLAQYDPAQTLISFYVRADSFEAYRKIRETLMAEGYQIGWSPYAGDEPLSLILSYRRKVIG